MKPVSAIADLCRDVFGNAARLIQGRRDSWKRRQEHASLSQRAPRVLALHALLWLVYANSVDRERRTRYIIDWATIAVGSLLVGYLLVNTARGISRHRRDPALIALYAASLTSAVLLISSFVYYLLGNTADFGRPLSHLDAFYFAVTVFTTTGFGDIQPRSQVATAVVTSEMLLGFVTVVAVVGLTIGAMTSRLSAEPASAPSAYEGAASLAEKS